MAVELTIGICAYNEENNIGSLLENISKQNMPRSSEVIVVCSGCTDQTVEIASDQARIDPRIAVLVEKERLGKPSAINKILKGALGKSIIFVSADTLPQKGCFNQLLAHLESSEKVGLVCGKPIPLNEKNSQINRMDHLLWSFHDHVFSELSHSGEAKHASEVFIIKKEAAMPIPLGIVNDDAYLAVMAKNAGWLVEYEPKAVVNMVGPQNIRDYLIQRRRVIFGHMQLKRKTGQSTQYFPFLLFRHPKTALKLASWLAANSSFPTLPIFLSIEAFLTGLAICENAAGKSQIRWKISSSTKKLN